MAISINRFLENLQKHKAFSLAWLIITLTFLFTNVNAQQTGCPNGAILVTSATTALATGSKYCVNNDITIGSLAISNGAELYIEAGKVLNMSGALTQAGGLIEIGPLGGIKMKGSASIGGFGTQNNTIVRLFSNAFFSVEGSLTQEDPSFFGNLPNGKSVFEVYDGAVVEACGTFTQQSITYPLVNYVGGGNANAYFISRAQASGGTTSIISSSDKVNFISMSTVDGGLSAGSANWCGENASENSNCQFWPTGLTKGGACGQAYDIVTSNPPTTPPTGCSPTGETTADLTTAFKGTVPTGTHLVWYATNDHTGPQVVDPTKVPAGTYYAFFWDETSNCFNTDVSTASVVVTILPPCEVDLAITKKVSNDLPKAGETITFEIEVENKSQHAVVAATVTDAVPTGYTIGAINNGGVNTSGTINWDLGGMAAGEKKTVSFEVTVLATGILDNTATVAVSAPQSDTVPTNNSSTVTVKLCEAPSIQVPLKGNSLNNK